MEKIGKELRVLHSAALLSPPSGTVAQMDWEQDAAKALGINWKVRMYCPLNIINNANIFQFDNEIDSKKLITPLSKLRAWIKLRKNYHSWLLRQQEDIDIFVLRYYVHDPYQLNFLLRCKKPVYFIHHTLEVPELALEGVFTGLIRSKLDSILGRITISKSMGVIGVTDEIVRYELKRADVPGLRSFVYPNGIFLEHRPMVDVRSVNVPELLFVANFSPWHGLDILLKDVVKSRENFIIHLVGKIPENLMYLTKDDRIKIHGHLNQEQIRKLSSRCCLGLASFALFRKKMKEACPLKVREYLNLGLPVYGDYLDVFPEEFKYYQKGNGTLEDLLDYVKVIRYVNKNDVVNAARVWVDKNELLSGLYNYLKKY